MKDNKHLRFSLPHAHLDSAYGSDWFARKAEAFARFFGTPAFLVLQTLVVAGWITLNAVGVFTFDLYPFIFLNLAFSLQAAYAAPLILLAQTRQADRDKAHGEADAKHREEIAELNMKQTEQLIELMKQNQKLSQSIRVMNERIEKLTTEIHKNTIKKPKAKSK